MQDIPQGMIRAIKARDPECLKYLLTAGHDIRTIYLSGDVWLDFESVDLYAQHGGSFAKSDLANAIWGTDTQIVINIMSFFPSDLFVDDEPYEPKSGNYALLIPLVAINCFQDLVLETFFPKKINTIEVLNFIFDHFEHNLGDSMQTKYFLEDCLKKMLSRDHLNVEDVVQFLLERIHIDNVPNIIFRHIINKSNQLPIETLLSIVQLLNPVPDEKMYKDIFMMAPITLIEYLHTIGFTFENMIFNKDTKIYDVKRLDFLLKIESSFTPKAYINVLDFFRIEHVSWFVEKFCNLDFDAVIKYKPYVSPLKYFRTILLEKFGDEYKDMIDKLFH
jgi:hypothetical protein